MAETEERDGAVEVSITTERKGRPMADGQRVHVDSGMGVIWLIGWLFTISFAKLGFWSAVLGLFIWPYYLGVAVR